MTIQDLTDKQRRKLQKACKECFAQRNKGRPVDKPYEWFEYQQVFADGVRETLKLIL